MNISCANKEYLQVRVDGFIFKLLSFIYVILFTCGIVIEDKNLIFVFLFKVRPLLLRA